MTTEQLNQARAERWHQAANPLLTADDAAEWLRETGVCLFLPRGQQLATAAPSFVEAVLGASNATPSREAIETAMRLLERLLASGDAVALNLLGTPGEQPDFLATTETLPFLFALSGDKEWKRGPRGKSSPLVIEVWKLLDREGPLTTIEVKEKLGRQLTEAAALRALTELWAHLRIEPVLRQGEPAGWQLLERARQKQMQAGSTMSQAVALSALASLYLQAVVAASGEEIEVFLSPAASRSKVRDVVRGLTATRQLGTLNLGPVEMYHVEGSLPEFAESERVEGVVVEAPESGESIDPVGEGRRRFVAKRLAAEAGAGADAEATRPAARRSFGKPAGPGRDRGADRSSGSGGADRRPFAPRPGGPGGERKPYGTRAPGGSSFNPREPWKEDGASAAPRAESGDRRPFVKDAGEGGSAAERRPYTPREGGERKPFTPRNGAKPFGDRKSFGERKPFEPRAGDERKPFTPREGGSGERKPFAPRSGGKPFTPRPGGRPFTPRDGERKPFAPRTGDRPFKPRSDAKPFGERKSFPPREGGERKTWTPRGAGDRKPFTPREGGDRKPFTPRDGERKPFVPRTGDRPFKPRSDAKPFGERKSFGERKPWTPREGDERKSFSPREGGDRKPFTPRAGGAGRPFTPRDGERKSFPPRTGDRPFKPRAGAKPFGAKPFGERKSFPPREGGERKPFAPREGGDRPFTPRAGAKPFGAKPFGSARPSGPGARKVTGFRKTTGATRARTSPMTSSGKPRAGVKPPPGRPGPRATRTGAAGARGGFKRTGRPGKGRTK